MLLLKLYAVLHARFKKYHVAFFLEASSSISDSFMYMFLDTTLHKKKSRYTDSESKSPIALLVHNSYTVLTASTTHFNPLPECICQ